LCAATEEIVAVFGQCSWCGDLLIDFRGSQRRARPGGGHTHRESVGFVGLAAVTGGQQTDSSGEYGRHVGDRDAVGQQAVG
jgi:hypothetical protein